MTCFVAAAIVRRNGWTNLILAGQKMNVNRYLYVTALAAGSLLLLMVLFGISSGVSQQTFEIIQPVPDYTRALLNSAMPLRVILGLDNIFIALYCTTMVFIVLALRTRDNVLVLGIVLLAGLAGGVLDYLENHHILTMLTAAEMGIPLEITEIKQQMVASMLKWHLAYFGFFLVAFVLRPQDKLESLFRFCLFYLQLPLGIFFYISTPFWNGMLAEVLFYLRYLNLVLGFGFFALIFYRRSLANTSPQHEDPSFSLAQ
ncbi:hypothetical protein A9Q99_17555 [Gammaproteobacteria bacterium 45_16_T64]|mgnify:CR=1 FL=1|nr:hypothetical protein A9Q99_17555 [Gammaproteobacteria bacterium 45_16_T64]